MIAEVRIRIPAGLLTLKFVIPAFINHRFVYHITLDRGQGRAQSQILSRTSIPRAHVFWRDGTPGYNNLGFLYHDAIVLYYDASLSY